MPYELPPVVKKADLEIFEAHFSRAFNPSDFERAKAIFEAVGVFNEHGIAVQLHIAAHAGKLEPVLAAYERLIGPESWLHLVPDAVTKAAEVREYKDVIYTSIIAEGENPANLLNLANQADVPKIFNLMGQDEALN